MFDGLEDLIIVLGNGIYTDAKPSGGAEGQELAWDVWGEAETTASMS